MEFQIITPDKIDSQNILLIYWDEFSNQIFIARKKNYSIGIDIHDGNNYSLISSLNLQNSDGLEKIYDLKFFEKLNQYCLSFGTSIALFDKNGEKILEKNRPNGVLNSKYVDENTIFLELYEFSGNRSLGVWNISNNTIKEYEIESLNHYNRSFKIDNTNKILYGTCNAYECGMNLHILNFKNEKLKFIKEEGLFCHRDEIENYALNINSLGDEFIMIVDNDDYPKPPTLCYYSIYNQKKPINEIKLFQNKNYKDYFKTSFLLDKYILIESNDKIAYIDPKDQKYRPNNQSQYVFFEKDSDSFFSVNNVGGKFIFKQDNILKICELLEKKEQFNEDRILKMSSFLENVEKYKSVEVGEYY